MNDAPRTARMESVTCCCAAGERAVVAARGRRGVDPLDLRVVGPAEAPRGDHERRDEEDRRQGDADGVRLAPFSPTPASGGRGPRQARRAASPSSPATYRELYSST